MRTDVGRGTDDFLRKLLQQKLPLMFLDQTGKDLRNREEDFIRGIKSRGRCPAPTDFIRLELSLKYF
jgi:hypothetical protein